MFSILKVLSLKESGDWAMTQQYSDTTSLLLKFARIWNYLVNHKLVIKPNIVFNRHSTSTKLYYTLSS